MDETVSVYIFSCVRARREISCTCAYLAGRIFLKFDTGDFLVGLSVGDILPTLQKDETPLDHILSQMSVYTTRIISTTTNLYHKWLTNLWCCNYSNMDLCLLTHVIYRVSIKSFPDYKHLLQEIRERLYAHPVEFLNSNILHF